jgi:two-component system response regulator RegX3
MALESERVLIAEDDPAIARVIARNLQREGLDVEIAPTGQSAWASLVRGGVIFLLVDYQLPDTTGETLCRQIRAHAAFASLPIAICTAKAHEIDTALLIAELQLTSVVPKPFSLREMVSLIRRSVEAHVA